MAEKSLMKGNEALAEAALRAGCKCFFSKKEPRFGEGPVSLAKKIKKLNPVSK